MADPTPPVASDPLVQKLTPFIGPLLSMAGTRKGVVMLGFLAFVSLVYWRDPPARTLLLGLIGVVLPAYFAAQTVEDNNKRKHEAEVTVAQIAGPAQAPAPVVDVSTTNVSIPKP